MVVSAGLDSVAREYWEHVLRSEPLFATSIGDRRFDDRLEDWSPDAVAARISTLERLLAEVGSVPAESLSQDEQVTRSELVAQLETTAAVLRSGVHEWTVDPLEGPQVAWNNVESYQPVRTTDEGRAMVERWRAMPAATDVAIANLRRSLADGRVATLPAVERVIDELDELLARPVDTWAVLAPARAERPGWPHGDVERFRADLRAAVEEGVRPAFGRLRAVLADEILPRARPGARPGILHVPGGAEAYRLLVRHHTSLEIEPEQLHAIGLREIERIDAEFVELGGRVLGTTGLPGTLERLGSDPALHFGGRDEIVATARRSLARAVEAIPDSFGRLPKAPCEVVPMGPHEEKHSTIAYYRQPAVDGSRPGQYFVNTHAPETRPRYEAEALAFHEAVPGHHLQIAIGQELPGLPEFRRHLGPTAFFEGWGLYTERLSDEMGLYSGDLDRFGILSFDAWRACRLVVDTGMHALGWSRDEAIAFMTAHTALGANNVVNEIDRYIVWPGQALAYKAGQLEIMRLRAEAQAALGPRFDVRGFHDVVLGSGAVRLSTLGELVGTWVSSTA